MSLNGTLGMMAVVLAESEAAVCVCWKFLATEESGEGPFSY